MQTQTQTQTINIKTPITLTVPKLENYFSLLAESLNLPLDSESLSADLLAEKKVNVSGKIFDLFDFASALEKLAQSDFDNFTRFLRDDYLEDVANTIYNFT